jgi:hypothetical protein
LLVSREKRNSSPPKPGVNRWRSSSGRIGA